MYNIRYIMTCKKLPLTNGANLIEGDSKCPHIRGGGELANSDALYGHPLQRKTTTCLLYIHLLLGVIKYAITTPNYCGLVVYTHSSLQCYTPRASCLYTSQCTNTCLYKIYFFTNTLSSGNIDTTLNKEVTHSLNSGNY